MKSIQTKLTVTIIVILLAALGTLGGLNYWKARQIFSETVTQDMAVKAEASAEDVGVWLEARKSELSVMSLAPVVQAGNPEAMASFLKNVVKENKAYASIGFIRPDGSFLNSGGSTGNLANREYFQRALKGETVISDPTQAGITGKIMVPVAIPVKDDGRIVGVLYGTINMDSLTQKICSIRVGQTGYAFVSKGDGLVIIHPNKEYTMKYNALTEANVAAGMREVTDHMV